MSRRKKKKKKNKKRGGGEKVNTRIAVVDSSRCKPVKCMLECRKYCPFKGVGCVKVAKTDKTTFIDEELCTGCGLCVRKCPYKAIQIVNLPKSLDSLTIHRYGKNGFKLHRLPLPKPNQVLGLVGTNGIGKTTALKILSGQITPNLGLFDESDDETTLQEVLKRFRGTELQLYFKKVVDGSLKVSMKPQYIDNLLKEAKKAKKGYTVSRFLKKCRKVEKFKRVSTEMDIEKLLKRDVSELSGGELQRVFIAKTCVSQSDMYMFDEPSSYLDVHQRIIASNMIRECCVSNDLHQYVICVEHDLAILDFLSDTICVLYGKPGGFGVVTLPFGVREGINIFLAGFIKTENVRFREFSLDFKKLTKKPVFKEEIDSEEEGEGEEKKKKKKKRRVPKSTSQYPSLKKTFKKKKKKEKSGEEEEEEGESEEKPSFELDVESGEFRKSEIIVMLGENGTGKTTMINILAGKLSPDDDADADDFSLPKKKIALKSQITILPKFRGTVQELFEENIFQSFQDETFQTEVFEPLGIGYLTDRKVKKLSGGELQRVAICLCLGKSADLYLLDEPSAYLDALQRIRTAQVIKRFIWRTQKTAFVVEHDFIMATYLADRVIVFDGIPAVKCRAGRPTGLLEGMNRFLKLLNITFRRDFTNFRPRINKLNSVKDREQKKEGNYFFKNPDDEDE